jgi:hypothetical protein
MADFVSSGSCKNNGKALRKYLGGWVLLVEEKSDLGKVLTLDDVLKRPEDLILNSHGIGENLAKPHRVELSSESTKLRKTDPGTWFYGKIFCSLPVPQPNMARQFPQQERCSRNS